LRKIDTIDRRAFQIRPPDGEGEVEGGRDNPRPEREGPITTQKIIKSKADVVDVCQSRIKGINAYVPAAGTVSCAGKTYTPSQLAAIYQRCIDTREQLVTLKHQEEVALQARAAADADRKAVDAGLIQWAVNTFGPQSQQAKDLGYKPRKPTPPTAETVAGAVQKAKATRTARGTRGKLQKKGIHGAATATEGTTPPAPTATSSVPGATPPVPPPKS
jgi:hypothetical protein